MANFLRKYNLPKLTTKNRAIFHRRNREEMSQGKPRKLLTANNFAQEFHQTIKKCFITVLFKLLQNIKKT